MSSLIAFVLLRLRLTVNSFLAALITVSLFGASIAPVYVASRREPKAEPYRVCDDRLISLPGAGSPTEPVEAHRWRSHSAYMYHFFRVLLLLALLFFLSLSLNCDNWKTTVGQTGKLRAERLPR